MRPHNSIGQPKSIALCMRNGSRLEPNETGVARPSRAQPPRRGCKGNPSAFYQTLLEHCDFRLAMQWWLGVPLLTPDAVGSCCAQCGACLNAWGDHAVACPRNGFVQRHSDVQAWLLHTARAAGVTCSKEAALPDNTRPADVLLHTWKGAGPTAVDVTVVHPLRPSEPRPPSEGVKRMLLREERAKVTK